MTFHSDDTTGGYQWAPAAPPPRSPKARGAIVAAIATVVLLVGGIGAFLVTRDGGGRSGLADSSTASGDQGEADSGSGSGSEDDGGDGDELVENDEVAGPAADLDDSSDGSGGTRATTGTTGSTGDTTGTTDDTTGTTGTTDTTGTTASGPTDIIISRAPTVNSVSESSFAFDYETNNVCGYGEFTVRDRATNAVIGSYKGDGNCFGPRHGGFPQLSHATFGGFDLKPGTTYAVSVKVNGVDDTDASLGLGRGSGSATTSFNVTTEGTPPSSGPTTIAITRAPQATVVNQTSFSFDYVTNDVCGSGRFTVTDVATNTVVGSFTGDGSCFGPRHGGSPQASHPVFGGYNLQPGTTYRVSITVEGIDASDALLGLSPGKGTASTSFNVTTAP